MTLRLATIQKCSRAFGQFCLSFSKRKKFGYNRTSFNTDSFRFRVRGVAGMDICVVLLLFIRMSCPRHEQKREVQCVFSRPCVLGGIFSLVFIFTPTGLEMAEFPHWREGRSGVPNHMRFIHKNSWHLHHVMFILSFSFSDFFLQENSCLFCSGQ